MEELKQQYIIDLKKREDIFVGLNDQVKPELEELKLLRDKFAK